MNVSFSLVESVLNTLPIGYYFGAKAAVKLHNGPHTYCTPVSNEIYISYPMIRDLMEKVKDDADKELEYDIRCLLYHELSHLILTPNNLMYFNSSSGYIKIKNEELKLKWDTDADLRNEYYLCRRDIENIVEDQRIETMLHNYFHGVDFPKFNEKLNAGAPDANDTRNIFFNAVIMHKGPKELVKAAEKLINDYAKFDISFDCGNALLDYKGDIFSVWYLAKTLTPESKAENIPEEKSEENFKENFGQNFEENISEEKPKNPSEENPSEEKPEEDISEEDISEEEPMEPVLENLPSIDPLLRDKVYEAARKVLERGLDREIEVKVNKIIKKALSKKALAGSMATGYSGIVDPRLTGNNDYRWFTRQGGDLNGKFSKLKLNLFVDVSGSFCPSENAINNLIRALLYAENEFRDFSFDVIKMGCTYTKNENGTSASNFIAKKENRYVRCSSGNKLDKSIVECFKKVQDATARNYNIVVFDGDAWSDTCSGDKIYAKTFNTPNTVIISDTANEKTFKRYCKHSKNIFVDGDYAKLLKDHVLHTLETALS